MRPPTEWHANDPNMAVIAKNFDFRYRFIKYPVVLDMNLRLLKHFLAIAEVGSLVEASRRLGVSQPSLSRDLKLLEQDLGVRLFTRDGRGVVITREGQAFCSAIMEHVVGLERAREEMIAKRAGYEGTIRLGWTGSISLPLGTDIIAAFTRQHPQVELHARIGSSAQIIDWVSSSAIDIGVMNSERPASGRFAENLARVPLFLVTAHSTATEVMDVSLREALRNPLFVHSQQNALGRIVRTYAKDNGWPLHIAAEVDDIPSVRPIIARGEAASIIPRGLLAGAHDLKFSVRRVVEPELWIYFHLAISRVGKNKPAVARLAQIIREASKDGLQNPRWP